MEPIHLHPTVATHSKSMKNVCVSLCPIPCHPLSTTSAPRTVIHPVTTRIPPQDFTFGYLSGTLAVPSQVLLFIDFLWNTMISNIPFSHFTILHILHFILFYLFALKRLKFYHCASVYDHLSGCLLIVNMLQYLSTHAFFLVFFTIFDCIL